MSNEILDKEEMEETLTLTGGELTFLDKVLAQVDRESIIPTNRNYTPLLDIRKEIRDARSEISDRHRELRSERNCEEDGHIWGSGHYEEDTDYGDIVLKGCKECPKATFRVVGEDRDWREPKEYENLGAGN